MSQSRLVCMYYASSGYSQRSSCVNISARSLRHCQTNLTSHWFPLDLFSTKFSATNTLSHLSDNTCIRVHWNRRSAKKLSPRKYRCVCNGPKLDKLFTALITADIQAHGFARSGLNGSYKSLNAHKCGYVRVRPIYM